MDQPSTQGTSHSDVGVPSVGKRACMGQPSNQRGCGDFAALSLSFWEPSSVVKDVLSIRPWADSSFSAADGQSSANETMSQQRRFLSETAPPFFSSHSISSLLDQGAKPRRRDERIPTNVTASTWLLPLPSSLPVSPNRSLICPPSQDLVGADPLNAPDGSHVASLRHTRRVAPFPSRRKQATLSLSATRTPFFTEEDERRVIFLPVETRLRTSSSGGCLRPTTCRPAVAMTGGIEGPRRSRLRRILNSIIRRRNVVADANSSEEHLKRFDADSLKGREHSSSGDVEDVGPNDVPEATKEPKRVLILMSDTGGGHRASAEALKATFELEFGNKYEVSVVDLWKDHTPYPFNQLPKSYGFMVKHESLWRMAFYATKPRFVHQPQMAATAAFVFREVSKMLDIHRPDIIVSVHPLMQHVPLRVLRARGLLHRIPFTTVITDLTTCHPTWFHKLATMCFCPTKEVADRALRAGLTPPQVRVHGLPVRPAFSRNPILPKDKLRAELEMDLDLPAVILIGGGEGMGPVEKTARALAQSLGGKSEGGRSVKPKGQMVVVCGRNKKLKEKLEAIDWPMPTQIKGFVTNMPDLMAACNCIITKAGPGTIAESLIRGLPLVLNDFIAGQEVGNVPYVVENGCGYFSEDPTKIAQIISDWFGPKAEEFAEMAKNARKLARPDAVFRIVHDLDHLAFGEKLVEQRELAYA